MRRSRGHTLIEMMGALMLITVAAGATLPTLTRTTALAREVDARLEDSAALSQARRLIAADLRAAEDVLVTPDELRVYLRGEDIAWRVEAGGLERSGTPVSRRITGLAIEQDDVVRVTLATASRERSFVSAPRSPGAR